MQTCWHENNLIYTARAGLYQNKVTCSRAVIQRPGHWTDNCKIIYWFQSGKKYCVAFSASQDPLVMQASMQAMVQWWNVGLIMRYARTSFDWFIYTRESIKCLYIQWVAYKYAIRKECLWIKSLVYCGKINGSETVSRAHENNTPAFH